MLSYSREKLINSIIYFLKNTKFCGKTKLFKLLFLLDFSHFKQTAMSVTGLNYFAWKMGPVPRDLYNELSNPKEDLRKCLYIPKDVDENGVFKLLPRCAFNPIFFTKRELKLMEQLAYIFKEAKADDMVEVTHLPNEPWHKTIKTKGEFKEIDYFMAIDASKESLSFDEAKDRYNDTIKITSLFQE
jgi:uncharacterized phage-associated protein